MASFIFCLHLVRANTVTHTPPGSSAQELTGYGRSMVVYRTIESLRLEKTSKIIKSNHPPNTLMPAKPCPEVPHLHVV